MKLNRYLLLIPAMLFTIGCSNNPEHNNNGSKQQYSTNKVKVKTHDFLAENALHDAVRANDLELAKFLIKQGAKKDQQDEYGYTPLHLAVRLHNYDIVQYLIEQNVNINTIDNFGDTPLLDSTRNNDTEISKELICNGAYRDVYDQHQMSTLNNSSKNNNKYISTLLRADTVEPYCQESIAINIENKNKRKICGNITQGYITSLIVNLEDSDENIYGDFTANVDNEANKWCVDITEELSNKVYTINAIGNDYVVNTATTQDQLDLTKLEIAIDELENTELTTPTICGRILSGDAVRTDILLSNDNNQTFGNYNATINQEEQTWCAEVRDELPSTKYTVLATAYDKDDKNATTETEFTIKEALPTLAIKINDNNETVGNKPKICGKITEGDIVRTDISLTNENNQTYGNYNANINYNNNTWCANVIDELPNGRYSILATGYNENNVSTTDTNSLNVFVIPGLYEALITEFKDDFAPWQAELDKDTLTWRFKNPTILFQLARKDLKEQFKEILDNFFPRYIDVLKDYEQQIEYVIVEGHSSSEHSLGKDVAQKYELNRILSQERADEVLEYAKDSSDERVMNNIVWILNKFKSTGMSSSKLIYNLDGSENKEMSRRVEFRIKTLQNQQP